jgi:phage/plasmid-like protein (TIGR03299 family)
MPAGITETDGMMYVGETPWHRLGVRLDGPATAAEAIEAAGLDWSVVTKPVYLRNLQSDSGYVEIDGKAAIVRSDTMETFGIMSNRYQPVQNVEAFRFFDSVIAQGEAVYHTAGSLYGGKKIWILAKLPEDIEVIPGDVIQPYILLSNSHDGSSALRMMNTPIRVVCGNTLSVALGERGGFYARHTGNVMQKVLNARHSIGLAHAYYEMFARTVDQLVNTRMTEIDQHQYLQDVYRFKADLPYKDQPRSKIQAFESTVDLLSHSTNLVGGIQGTKWAALNAVTYYVDHEKAVRGSLDRRDDRKLDRTWFGSGAELRQRAYELLTA